MGHRPAYKIAANLNRRRFIFVYYFFFLHSYASQTPNTPNSHPWKLVFYFFHIATRKYLHIPTKDYYGTFRKLSLRF